MSARKQPRVRFYLALLAFSFVSTPGSEASELLYRPINPSFGGNPFNSSHLLGLADRQNKFDDNGSGIGRSSSSQSQADLFVRSLSSRLLSSLAGQVTDAIFGDNPQESGTVVFGDVTIEFERGLEFVLLTITDAAAGSVTEISVPIIQAPP